VLSRDVVLPAQAFVHAESIGGLALMAAALSALIWANLPGDTYERFWHETVSIDLGILRIDETLQHWVNDGLMAVFFFVVGLEIKRELLVGELSSRAQAILPAAAAVGGMVAPALIFLAFNASGDERDGWGIVIATDIAFAVGVLALLSRYVPQQARVFLLAVAIFDDLAAIAVIAVFFTEDISWQAIAVAGGVAALAFSMRRSIAENPGVLIVFGLVLWGAVFQSGIHATIAGVLLAMLVPSRSETGQASFVQTGPRLMARFSQAVENRETEEADVILGQLEEATRDTEAPLERLERSLHPLSSLLVIPVFALANAGIEIGGDTFGEVFTTSLGLGVLLGLFLGKPIGIVIATLIATRTGLGALPRGVGLREVVGVGLLAGIGFTVSIFITSLSLDVPAHVETAKAGIFVAFILSTLAGLAFLRLTPRSR
jgi:NhaA family Na+:H+ antiporter